MVLKTVDQLNTELLFPTVPKRIISLVPAISELLAHYEPDISLIGITRFCEHPLRLRKEKHIVGGTKDPDIKKILELKPDLIIANKEENRKEDIDALRLSCPVWISDVSSLDSGLEMVSKLEGLLQIPTAKKLSATIKSQINSPLEGISGTVAYVIWQDPIMIAGNDTFISSWLNKIGLKNITKKKRYPEISIKWLNKQSPDYIFLSSEPFPFKEKNRLQFQSNCKNSKVVLVDGRLFSWYGKAIIEAPKYFTRLISSLTA